MAIHEEIVDAGAGYVVPRAKDSLAASLKELLGDRDAASEMGSNGRALAKDVYSWQRMTAGLEDMYERTAHSRA